MSAASTATKPKLEGAALAPLVYWLLVIAGLAGITLLRFGSYGSFVTSDDVLSLWFGSILGVAFGQLASWARVRVWVPIVVAMFGFWFLLPILFLVVDGIFGASAQTFCLAFIPALVCGYLSLTERGALVSFWYPSVLWMIVILDGPIPGTFDERFALPFVVGLAALFVVYLRARQTRRVAIWKAHGTDRLAAALPRTVLRTSPLRTAAQHVFTAMTGAAALVLTAWIAPHLWQTVKDPWRTPSGAAAHGSYGSPYAHAKSGAKPCCPTGMKKRERVKEYFPIQRAHDTDEDDVTMGGTCRVCSYEGAVASNGAPTKWNYGGTPGSGLASGVGTGLTESAPFGAENPWGYGTSYGSYGSYGSGSWSSTSTSTGTSTTTADHTTITTATPPAVYDPPPVVTPPAKIDPVPTQAAPKPETVTTTKAADPAVVDPKQPTTTTTTPEWTPPPPAPTAGTAFSFPAPWKSSLGLCTIAFAFILASRAARRALTLRHLAHPFWNESFDQRISNHWERMLIGLRDAGLEPREGEQPLAFAKRIGIDGMEACATILERVRHGVRVDEGDLANMSTSADQAFRSARRRAGVAARVTAWLRPPTA